MGYSTYAPVNGCALFISGDFPDIIVRDLLAQINQFDDSY